VNYCEMAVVIRPKRAQTDSKGYRLDFDKWSVTLKTGQSIVLLVNGALTETAVEQVKIGSLVAVFKPADQLCEVFPVMRVRKVT
jgi:hypothetical protein